MTAGDRRLVRQAVAGYFGGAQSAEDGGIYFQGGPLAALGLGTAFPYLVKGSAPDSFYTAGAAAGFGWGAALTVSLGPERIMRSAWGGPVSGWRKRMYETRCSFDVISYEPHLEQAEAGLDDLVDAFLGLIYADRTLGTTSPDYPTGRLITQAGEDPAGITVGPAEWEADPDRGEGRGGLMVTFDSLTMVQA